MSSTMFTCVQCTRRLSRLARSAQSPSNVAVKFSPRLSRNRPSLVAMRCNYATTSKSNRVVARLERGTDHFSKVRFTLADLPPREFWDQRLREPPATDLTADECLQTARGYAEAALKDARGWRERIISMRDVSTARSPNSQGAGKGTGKGKGKTLSAYTLHHIAVKLILTQPGPATHLAMHILDTLTRLDYAPSILSLARLAYQRHMLDQPQFERAMAGLERILRRVSDSSGDTSTSTSTSTKSANTGDFAADACTLRGLVYAAENTAKGDDNALWWFREADKVAGSAPEPGAAAAAAGTAPAAAAQQAASGGGGGGGDQTGEVVEGPHFDPRWQWKESFFTGVAGIQLRRGELDQAAGTYARAAAALDSAAAYLGAAGVLEKMGRAGTAEYAEALEKAAVSGNLEAARRLGVREWDRAAEPGLGKAEKRRRQVLAEEWMAVAGAMVPTEA
ncbi:hypothetical protein F4802DRAFT_619438 [Xylaria palmicola]|nr:hypothetical protein F4802DRAFT_619438 [Xylaria palmicola]